MTLLQLCITYNCQMQECLFSIFDYYYFAIPLILLSIAQHRSVINVDINVIDAINSFHNFIFIGKPRGGNDANNIPFSPPVQRY